VDSAWTVESMVGGMGSVGDRASREVAANVQRCGAFSNFSETTTTQQHNTNHHGTTTPVSAARLASGVC
jgi:hypothetical protein